MVLRSQTHHLASALGTLFLLGAFTAPLPAASSKAVFPGPVEAAVLRVIDGDTLVVRARIWLGQSVAVTVRLNGIDAPEPGSRCQPLRRLAERARNHLARLVQRPHAIVLRNIRHGKFAGRVVADVHLPDGRNVSTRMLAAGLAEPWTGRRCRTCTWRNRCAARAGG